MKINITDLNLLRITRVRTWSIAFDYDGKHFLLHGTSELGEGSAVELFEKTYDANGKYHLEHFQSVNGEECIALRYLQRQNGKTIVYSQINKEYFALQLTNNGFATGIMEAKAAELKKKQKQIQNKISKYRKKILELQSEYSNLATKIL